MGLGALNLLGGQMILCPPPPLTLGGHAPLYSDTPASRCPNGMLPSLNRKTDVHYILYYILYYILIHNVSRGWFVLASFP